MSKNCVFCKDKNMLIEKQEEIINQLQQPEKQLANVIGKLQQRITTLEQRLSLFEKDCPNCNGTMQVEGNPYNMDDNMDEFGDPYPVECTACENGKVHRMLLRDEVVRVIYENKWFVAYSRDISSTREIAQNIHDFNEVKAIILSRYYKNKITITRIDPDWWECEAK